jgi:ABC-type lipoprotein export system ATPase subunit
MFDGMDKCGCEAVAGLLRDMSAETPTTLITHDTSLKPYANYIVTVRTAHNRATLRGKEA